MTRERGNNDSKQCKEQRNAVLCRGVEIEQPKPEWTILKAESKITSTEEARWKSMQKASKTYGTEQLAQGSERSQSFNSGKFRTDLFPTTV